MGNPSRYHVVVLDSNSTTADRILPVKGNKRKASSPKVRKAKKPAPCPSSGEENSGVGSSGDDDDDDEDSDDCGFRRLRLQRCFGSEPFMRFPVSSSNVFPLCLVCLYSTS